MTDEEMAKGTVEIDNPCYHCYTGAIGECFGIGCKYVSYPWSGDLEADYKVEVEKGGGCTKVTEVEIKELARKYINSCTKREGFVILTEGIMNDFIDLFVAGFMKCLELKAGSPKWHKVADGDLPKEDTIVLICYQGRGTIHYDIDYYCNKCFKWRDLRDIIAWREIPKYMEE